MLISSRSLVHRVIWTVAPFEGDGKRGLGGTAGTGGLRAARCVQLLAVCRRLSASAACCPLLPPAARPSFRAEPRKRRRRGIAVVPAEGPLYRENCDSSPAPLRGSARNDNVVRAVRSVRALWLRAVRALRAGVVWACDVRPCAARAVRRWGLRRSRRSSRFPVPVSLFPRSALTAPRPV